MLERLITGGSRRLLVRNGIQPSLKVYSHIKTYSAYIQTAMELACWIKNRHPEIKKINEINKEHAIQYLQARQTEGKSAYTITKDVSAINKAH
jgi:site-specific recombinase XerD